MEKENRNILTILLNLFLLQIGRIIFKTILFLNIERTIMNDTIVNMLYMFIAICIGYIFIKSKNVELNIFPKKFNNKYIIISVFLILFFIITPIITKNNRIVDIMSLIYSAIITVVYEELIFRGYIYNKIELYSNSIKAYTISTILFGIWHLGYIDTIIWRTSMFNQNTNILKIMIWKVITGFILGSIFGFFRHRNKNVYSSMLIHSFINCFGA